MANLGNTSAPGGVWTDVGRASTQWYTGPFTMPNPGGTITDMYLGIGPDGNSSCDFCIWFGSTLQYHDTNHFLGTLQTQHLGGLNIWCPGGTQVYLGMWQAGSTGIEWNVGGGGGVTFQSAGSPANRSGGADEYGGAGDGGFQAYVAYTPLPAPTLSNVSPAVAPAGNVVTLTGTNLLHTTGITCCGVAVTSYTIVNDTTITMTVPAGASGAGNIVVTTPAGNASIAFVAGRLYWGSGGAPSPVLAVYQPGTNVKVIAVYGPGTPPVRLF